MPKPPEKTINLYDEPTAQVWARARDEIRERFDAPDASEGDVLGQLLAKYQEEEEGPLEIGAGAE